MKFDKWVGNIAGGVILEIKYLVYLFGCRIDLHKIHRPDEEGQFHSHPAYAIRIILKGGYIEEVYKGASDDEPTDTRPPKRLVRWFPDRIGIVTPHFIHRIDTMIAGPSYSLWIRGPIVAHILLMGWGWPADLRGRTSKHVKA